MLDCCYCGEDGFVLAPKFNPQAIILDMGFRDYQVRVARAKIKYIRKTHTGTYYFCK
jgi:hypothetical protein